jgi:hypothetical protein
MQVVASGAGGAGGAGGPIQRPTEPSYRNDRYYGQAFNFQAWKDICKNRHVFQIHADTSFLKDAKNMRVIDFLAELHMQYLYVMQTKAIPSGMPILDHNGGLFNSNDLHHPFNMFMGYIVLPVLARYVGHFPAGTLVEGQVASQAAQDWLASVVYDDMN